MNRREFLKASGAAGVLASLNLNVLNAALGQSLRTGYIPADKGVTPELLAALRRRGERRVYRGPRRFAIGMPCGGVAAGQLYVLGDGTLGGWRIDGRANNTGYGSSSYKVRPQARELAQGFTLVLEDAGAGGPGGSGAGRLEARLADVENGGSYGQVEFIGEYPVAEVRYGKPQDASFPVEATLRAGSPFIPLNARDSCLPCTLLRFTLRNTSDRRVAGRLVGHLQNGVGAFEPGEVPPLRRNRALARDGRSLVLMEAEPAADVADPRPERVLFDFDGPHYDGWEVRGTAFGLGPAKGTLPKQQDVKGFEGAGLVNSFLGGDEATGEMISEPFTIDRRFLTLLIGGGRHAGKTCVNLLVDGVVVRTAMGRNTEKLEPHTWDVRPLEGREARLQIVDSHKGSWGHISVDSVRLVDSVPESARQPRPDSLTFGSMALAVLGAGALADAGGADRLARGAWRGALPDNVPSDGPEPLVCSLAAPFELSPGESREITFVVAWHFPNLHTGGGVMYANWFRDAAEVVDYVAVNLDRLVRETELFHRTWYEDTTLPWWLALRLFMPTANLATGTAQWWNNGRFWCWEGVGCCEGTCTHVWNYAHAEARLFPELARSTRVMQDLGTAFEEATGRVAFRGKVDGGSKYAADGQSGTVLKCYREHLCSADDAFLRANWPRIRQVLEYQIGRDAMARIGPDTEPDGMIEVPQHNTYDIDFHGPNSYVGSLYHAALLAGAKMAELMGDAPAAERYRAIAQRGRRFTEERLFRGGYFIQLIPDDAGAKWQYGTGCLTDQLFGQNWARCLGLGTLYDEEKVVSGLRSVYRFNFSPAVGQYNADYPPERAFADGRDAGLFICTWPEGGRPKEPVRYRDEVWTGCEYQAAGGLLWEAPHAPALADEALVVLNAIDQRYDGAARNPWNEVECGDHYGRALASYGTFQALCGFVLDGPAGLVGIAPRLSPERFAAFFAGPEGWGLATQTRDTGRQVTRFEVRWGRLRAAAVRVLAPWDNVSISAACAERPVETTSMREGDTVTVRLARAEVLQPGEALEIAVSA
jgi:non-lysosomal glucosylceramidase